MKILKKATQKNLILNNAYYTPYDINYLLREKEICYFNEKMNECYDEVKCYNWDENEYRIFTEEVQEIKVILDDYGYYTTVAIGKNGHTYFISL